MHSGAYRRKRGEITSIVWWWWWAAWSLVTQHRFSILKWKKHLNAGFEFPVRLIGPQAKAIRLKPQKSHSNLSRFENNRRRAKSSPILLQRLNFYLIITVTPIAGQFRFFEQSVIAFEWNLLLGRSPTNCNTNCMALCWLSTQAWASSNEYTPWSLHQLAYIFVRNACAELFYCKEATCIN